MPIKRHSGANKRRSRAEGEPWLMGYSGNSQIPRTAASWRATIRRRVLVISAVIVIWAIGIETRLIHLQVFQHNELLARAGSQQLRTVSAPAKRGELLDRLGRVLAFSVNASSIYAVPPKVENPDQLATILCAELDNCGDHDRQIFAERFRQPKGFVWVRRKVSPEEANRIASLNLEGIGFLSEDRRFYPNKELAAHLLGYVGIDNQGLSGVESTYDAEVRGRPGKVLIQTDARGRAFSRVEQPPTTGATLELTIDKFLQHIAERELRRSVEENGANGGTIIILDPASSEVLALANEPTFNPNMFANSQAVQRRNRAIQDVYEPGSVFKVVTASAALEEKIVEPGDQIDVSDGMIMFGSRRIDDEHRYDTLSFTDVIVKSSNVGTIKVGLQLGPERLDQYIKRFGFGETLSRDFQGESRGIVWDPADLDDSALASVAMGYQIGVTPLQMVTAISSVANGGYLIEPRLVRAVIRQGMRIERPRGVISRVITPETASKVTTIMEQVVSRGTARGAHVPGHTVAGKTGTSAKFIDGAYSKSDYNASFVGFVPSRQPVLTILVVIDTPRGSDYYGGTVAAPVFKRVAEAALRHLGVARTIDPIPAIRPARLVTLSDERNFPIVSTVEVLTSVSELTPDREFMPSLKGMDAREAIRVLTRLGLTASLNGDGFVVGQEPIAGFLIDQDTRCTLWLERWSALSTPTRLGQ